MTQEAIQQAITQLETAGARVSVRQVHKMTGGSFRDIARLRRALAAFAARYVPECQRATSRADARTILGDAAPPDGC
jgi:hypothetical protein